MSNPADASLPDLIAAADRCVACGLCLPHCPSYRVDPTEGESPRGRISLIRGWASGALAAEPALQRHLDQCLGCLNCQSVCPAQVDYQRLIVGARSALPPAAGALARWARWLVAGRLRLRLANALLRLAMRSRAGRWIWPRSLRERLAGLPRPAQAPATSPQQPVWLYGGCLSAPLDDRARAATVKVLERLGLPVHDDRHSGCCGLMAQMAGDQATAERLGRTLTRRLQRAGVQTLVSISSGCHGRLADLCPARSEPGSADRHSVGDPPLATAESLAWPDALRRAPVLAASLGNASTSSPGQPALVDLATLVERQLAAHPASLVGRAEAAVYYEPCSQRAHAAGAAWQRLLTRIPGLKLLPLADAPSCCGAAGAHHLDHQTQSAALRDALVERIRVSGASRVLTSNAGCAQALRAGLAAAGVDISVAHPIELLAAALAPHDPARAGDRLRDRA